MASPGTETQNTSLGWKAWKYHMPMGFIIVFIQVVSNRNQVEFQFHEIQASAHDPLVAAILFHDAESAFRLDGSVHAQQGSVGTLQVVQDLPVHRGQFQVQLNTAIAVGLLALACVGTAAAILAFIDFFLSAIQVPFDCSSISKPEYFSARANQISGFVCLEVDCPEWVVPIFFIRRFLLVHWKLHELLHPVLLAVDVIVI